MRWSLLFVFLLLTWAPPAGASDHRVALLVGHPFGGDGLEPLRYVANDLERMREVLATLGDFTDDDILVSFGENADEVLDRFDDVRAKLRPKGVDHPPGDLFLFYYTGHAKDGEIRLGDTRLPLTRLRELIQETHTSVRVALLDSCRSGSITKLKGAIKGEPVSIAVEDGMAQKGQVLIAASSEHEDAQESDDIQGSFFTHFLTSGLRGAADQNHDGAVTLAEAYAFAFSATVARTVGTRGGIQHPTYRFDLRGTGNLVLTRPGRPTSAIAFGPNVAGHFVLFNLDQHVVVAELDKQVGQSTRVAVAPGRYAVKLRATDHLKMQDLTVRPQTVAPVDPAQMRRVAFADDYAKGAVVTSDEIRYGRLGIRLSAAMGAQTFLSAPARGEYFPTIGLFGVALDLDHLFRRHLGLRVDLALGQSAQQTLVLDDPYLGQMRYDIELSQLTGGVSMIGSWNATDRWTLGGSFRLGFVLIERRFLSNPMPNQQFSTLTPGLGLEVGFRLAPWLTAGLRSRIHYMFFNVDTPMSLAYLDGGLVVTAVLR